MLNSISQWVFIKNGYFSITISAANDLLFEQKEKMVSAIIGDWTQFNFPSTIESSILSAKKLCQQLI